jgi:hypothetical protein
MELILRKRSTGELVRLRRAKVLSHYSRKLAFLAPYAGQWMFYALTSSHLRYNRQPAPARRRVVVGDLLDLNSLELVVDFVEAPAGEFVVDEQNSSFCEIEVPGRPSVRVSDDTLIACDPKTGACFGSAVDGRPLMALLTFASGRWHLHDLNGNALVRNGAPAGLSVVLADGDRIRIQNQDVVFRIGHTEPADGRWWNEPETHHDEEEVQNTSSDEIEISHLHASPSQEIDILYRMAKTLCQRLLPTLRQGSRTFPSQTAAYGGVRGWLRLLRPPSGPVETLERLEFFLSGAPRDRVWLLELSRFLYQQSYFGLCLKVVKELCRLWPLDGDLMQTLAKVYFQQGRNAHLPAAVRLNALDKADKCVQVARRLTPWDRVLGDLHWAVGAERTGLRGRLAGAGAQVASRNDPVDALGDLK